MAFRFFSRRKRHLNGREVDDDEVIVFYPSYGHRDPESDSWLVRIQGCIFEPERNSIRRRLVLEAIRMAMKIERQAATEHFARRMAYFLDDKQGRVVSVRLGERVHRVGTSKLAGLFRGEVELPHAEIEELVAAGRIEDGWLSYDADLPDGDARHFHGKVQLIPEEGLTVISDIDDTIKHSNVSDRRDLFHNTFVRHYKSIPGMSELYRELAEQGVVFHYVTGSPWQLYEPLSELWGIQGFPHGSFHMKTFRWRDVHRLRRPLPKELYKRSSIEPILEAYPKRRFILIGDSGEEDPEIYASLFRTHSEQIVGAFIRKVERDRHERGRFERAFDGLETLCWQAFDDPEQIREPVMRLLDEHHQVARVT